jgi:hypothetical protein
LLAVAGAGAIAVRVFVLPWRFTALTALLFGSVAALFMIGAGLILTLINFPAVGAWIGGLGLVLEAFVSLPWRLVGTHLFP